MASLVALFLAVGPSVQINGVAMQMVRDSVYAEAPVSAEEARAIRRDVDAAYEQIRSAFGNDLAFTAVVFTCRTAACKVAFGASPQAATSYDLGFASVNAHGFAENRAVVVTGPNTLTRRILTHELVHAVMKSWVPYDALPIWFNEGLAVAIADNPDCASFAPSSELDIRILTTKAEWQAHLEATRETR